MEPFMKIGVISDTHLKENCSELERTYDTYLKDVDLILHAGDVVDINVLDVFLPKKVEVVAGNMDLSNVRDQFPIKKVIKIKGFKIGLIHGWGSPKGIEERIRNEFTNIDCLVYGHTHNPVNHVKDGILFFNPGSATEKFYTKRNTLGILEISDQINGRIIKL
ncbi:MAG: metallophosphoesterase [Deltaproteobacteria bacterium]|nr:MAG: metallophosphoesterase [Deltaproteobacteria bacterium]